MGVFKQKPKSGDGGGNYELPPDGSQAAVLVGIIDLGSHTNKFAEDPLKLIRQVMLCWELTDEKKTNGHNHVIGRVYTLSLHKKASLRNDVIKPLVGDPSEDQEFDITTILGIKCLVSIVHEASKSNPDKSYAKVTSVSKPAKSMKVPEPTIDPLCWEITEGGLLPENLWLPFHFGNPIQEVIRESPEWKAVEKARDGDGVPSGNGQKTREPAKAAAFDDSIPF